MWGFGMMPMWSTCSRTSGWQMVVTLLKHRQVILGLGYKMYKSFWDASGYFLIMSGDHLTSKDFSSATDGWLLGNHSWSRYVKIMSDFFLWSYPAKSSNNVPFRIGLHMFTWYLFSWGFTPISGRNHGFLMVSCRCSLHSGDVQDLYSTRDVEPDVEPPSEAEQQKELICGSLDPPTKRDNAWRLRTRICPNSKHVDGLELSNIYYIHLYTLWH